MNVLLISTCKEKLHEQEFVEPFVQYLTQKKIHIARAHYQTVTEKELNGAERILICGTGLADNDYLEHTEKFGWIPYMDVPILGVCSGIQSVVFAFNGKVIPEKEIGMVTVKGDLFGKKEFEAYALHQNGISVSKEFDVLARSASSIHAIKHKTKPIYGVLFHPEVRNLWVIDEFLKL